MLWEISLLIIGISFLLLVIFAIPTLRQIRATAKKIESTSAELNQRLPDILENVKNLSLHVSETSGGIKNQMENVSGIVHSVQGMVDDIVNFEKSIKHDIGNPIIDLVSTLTALVKGFTTFIETMRSK
jgi:uncharacterized protein YoxC